MGEVALAAILCSLLEGQAEARHDYVVAGQDRHIRVDCETENEVIEIGLDRRSSFDSVHQAVFAAHLTGKAPRVVVLESDHRLSAAELQILAVCERLGIAFDLVPVDDLTGVRGVSRQGAESKLR